MEFVIKIYGAPYGFDLYEGSEQDLNYFQVFDNGSTEPVKMTVHRISNNQISYNYLRYGYVTSGGRTGSFFGMSIVFNKSYCSDFMRMYQLFEAVYGTITKNAILLEEFKSGQWQAKYKIGKFSEAEDEVRRINGVLGQNIQGALANDIKPMTFPTTVSGDKELRLPANISNNAVTNAVEKYSVVSISPAYNIIPTGGADGVEVQTVPLEMLIKLPSVKNKILTESTDWSNRVNAFQTDFRAHKDTNRNVKLLAPQYRSIMEGLDGLVLRIDNLLNNVQKWQQIEPTRPLFEEVRQEVTTSKDHINSLLGSLRLYEDTFKIGGGSGGQGGSGGETGGSSGDGPSPFELFVHKHKNMLIAAGVALLLIIGSVVTFNIIKGGNSSEQQQPGPGQEEPSEPKKPRGQTVSFNVDSLVKSGMAKYDEKKYTEAYSDFKSAGRNDLINECRENYKSLCIATAKRKRNENEAISYFTSEMAKVEYEVTEQDKQSLKDHFTQKYPKEETHGTNQAIATTVVTGNIQFSGDNVQYVNGRNNVKKNTEFTMKFVSNTYVDGTKLKWKIDNKDTGTGNPITKSMNDMGPHTVEVYYNDTRVSTGSFKVIM